MSWDTIRINEDEKYIGKANSIIIDLRRSEEYKAGHICGAVNIPYEELERCKCMLRKYATIFLYCDRGNTSMLATRDLYKEGYPAVNLYGGVRVYRGKLVK